MLAFLALAIWEPYLYQNFFANTSIKKLKGRDFQIIARRGSSGVAPENTMIAFQKALDLKVDMIHLDVRHTKDEEIVVFHDQTLDRTTNGNGNVHDYNLSELKQLDAGSWFDLAYSDQKIPTLREALDLIDGKCKALIEIKHMDHPHYQDFAEKLVNVIRKEKNGFEWCILQSLETTYLDKAHELEPLIQTKPILVGEDSTPLIAFYVETRLHLGRSSDSNHTALNPNYQTLSPRRVFRMHARGFDVFAYPVNKRKDMIIMLNMGVDGIITDYPSISMKLRRDIASL